MSSLNPDNACRLLKALGATQENEYRSKGRIFRKGNKYLVVHDNKQSVIIAINKTASSGEHWLGLPEELRTRVFKRNGTGKAVVKQYLGHDQDDIVTMQFSSESDIESVFHWYTK